MAVLCGYSVMRSAASPSISAFRCSLCRLRISTLCRSFMLPLRYPSVRCENRYCSHVFVSSSPVHSLVDMVMEEFEESRRRRRVRVNVKMKLETGELIEKRPVVQELQKGRLLEFKKDTDRILLAVAQKPDGKKNWMVSDQVLLETTTSAFE